MGEHSSKSIDKSQVRDFLKHLLADLRAFEKIVDDGMIESGVRRIGAEQELFLVDEHWRPAPMALDVLKELNDPLFTTELALFNLECNLDPMKFGGDCLSKLERNICRHLDDVRQAAERCGGHVVMTGILPSLHKSDLDLKNITPMPRYYALNDALTSLRGSDYEFKIRGIDELNVLHDSVMVEACNTSFQVHFQVGVDEFAKLYNVAQAVSAPVLAAASNSPMLFGRRLWQETRIALFEQSVDTRKASHHLRELSPRVKFGLDWVKKSPVEIFREDITRFRVLLSTEIEEDPLEEISQNRAPQLKALRLHNGTVYRWNRICYGISDGIPHLRIENRILPSGPTPLDEVANAAFWFGLMSGVVEQYDDITQYMEFSDAKTNFLAAAQMGLNAQLSWLQMRPTPASSLILEHLLPLARAGLDASLINSEDSDRYLGVIEERVKSRQTGSQWMLNSIAKMRTYGTAAERTSALTAAIHHRQCEQQPVHEWDLARLEESGGWKEHYLRIEQYMKTDLVTVRADETIELVANLMDWHHIRHVLVEDRDNRLVGVVSHRDLIRILGNQSHRNISAMPVSEIMKTDLVTATPESSTVESIEIMRERKIACLPVLKGGRLVGVVTDSDFMEVAGQLLEQKLRE